MAIVYCAENTVNKGKYIGVSVRTLLLRKREHVNDAKRPHRSYCRIFCKAIRKYGADAFQWSVLGEYPNAAEAYAAEIEFIERLRPEYNISTGGDLGTVGVVRSQQWKDNISRSLKGKILSPEHRLKAIAGCAAGRAKRGRPVVCLEDGKWFCGMREAEIFYKMPKSSIRNIFDRGQTKTHGLHFVESKIELSQEVRLIRLREFEARARAEKDRLKSGLRNRPIKCLPDGKKFRSVRDAAAHYGITSVTVHVKLKTGLPTVRRPGGLIFQYV